MTRPTACVKHLLSGFCVLAILLSFTTSPSALGTREEDRAIIEEIVRDCIGWALTKDRPRLESILAHDEDFFIFHPDWEGTVVGWEAFAKLFNLWLDPRFKATHMDIRDLRINFSDGGDVAWYSCILDDCYEWDGEPGCWKDTRWTGVLEKREGSWVIVQMHFSFASDKVLAEAGEQESDPEKE